MKTASFKAWIIKIGEHYIEFYDGYREQYVFTDNIEKAEIVHKDADLSLIIDGARSDYPYGNRYAGDIPPFEVLECDVTLNLEQEGVMI